MNRSLLATTTLALLCLAAAPPAPTDTVTTVVVVRHAEKQADGTRDPHLTAAGRARAETLAAMLAALPVGGLYTSEFYRTRETLEPLAEQTGTEIVTVPAADTIATLTTAHLAAEHPGEVVVVASHSNLAPGLVEALTGMPVPPIDESTHDDLFVVSLHQDGSGHFVRFKYGPGL